MHTHSSDRSPPPGAAEVFPLDDFDPTDHTSSRPSSPLLQATDFPRGRPPTPTTTGAQLSLFNAFALLIGSQIGSGIFSSPAQVDHNVGSPGAALLLWLFAGLTAWTGAATFAELGAAIQRNGGMQEYLQYIYGDGVASTMSLIYLLVIKPSGMAIQSIVFAEYWIHAVVVGRPVWWAEKVVAVAVLGTVWALNSLSKRASTRFTDAFLFLKLGTIALIIVLAALAVGVGLNGDGRGASRDWRTGEWFSGAREEGASGGRDIWDLLGRLSAALYAGLWAYGGWDHVNLVTAEMRDAARDLPRGIHTAFPTVISCYTLAILSYYLILPWRDVANEDAIAVAAGCKTLGPFGAIAFAILVSASCLGSLNIGIFTTGKLTVAAAQHGYLPKILAGKGPKLSVQQIDDAPRSTSWERRLQKVSRWATIFLGQDAFQNTPIAAMGFNASIACIYALLGTFGALTTFIGLAEYMFYFLTVGGALVLRWTQPQLPRPYLSPLWMPILFTLVSFLLVIRGGLFAPAQAIMLIILVVCGFSLQWYKRRLERATEQMVQGSPGMMIDGGDSPMIPLNKATRHHRE